MSYTVPYSFVPGTKARAQEVNANFASILDSLGNIDANKVNLDLSNITSSGLEVIKNNSSVRNIGELIFSPIPLADANLHLLDGSLIQGNGIYHDFVNYIKNEFNSNSTYNPDIFTITGNPTITENGIASGFSRNPVNNIRITQGINSSNYTIVGEFTSSQQDTNFTIPFEATCTINGAIQLLYSIRFDFTQQTIYLILRTSSNSTANITTARNFLNLSTSYKYEIIVEGSNITFKIDGNTIGSLSNFCGLPVTNIILGAGRDNNDPFPGTIDLKEFSVIENNAVTLSGKKNCNYFTDEGTWQDTVTTYGECGKFVYNEYSNTVRLPKIKGLIEYTSSTSEAGNLTEAGLPNITGSVDEMCTYSSNAPTGAIYETSSVTWKKAGTDQTLWHKDVHFDASRCSDVYGNSSTVQPQTIKYLIYIVVASMPKTDLQVNIDNIATDLNGKLDADFTNLQDTNIRNFDGQWIYSSTDILSNVSANGNTGYEYSLSSYLPNDTSKYEVLFAIWGKTEATSGNAISVWAGTDIVGSGTADSTNKIPIIRINAVNSAAQYGGSSAILPVGTGRKLYLFYSNSNTVNGIYMKAYAYRRIGTNN